MQHRTFNNPLEEPGQLSKTPDLCILVIFGATGDLTERKLVPALYNLAKDKQLPRRFACVGFARREKTHELFREEMYTAINTFSRNKPADPDLWASFEQQLFYHCSEFDNDDGYISLKEELKKLDEQIGCHGNRIYYLSTQPSFFPIIVEKLHQHHLILEDNGNEEPWSRVIFEKPFGHDTLSAQTLQSHVLKHLTENQIYRIDHYLGKETVQNILTFRFSNAIFESVWNNRYIDHMQISVAEDIGIGRRGRFFEEAGMLRDIVQNHLMQLLTLVTMEPPVNLSARSVRNEKVKILDSIRPISMDQFDESVIRGQYAPGYIDGKSVKGYREEDLVDPKSAIETFVALDLRIDNWRWSGIPFYLRAGKRLPKRVTEIAVYFKANSGFLFKDQCNSDNTNALIIRIQPNEGISLNINCKIPGSQGPIHPVNMDFRYGSFFGFVPPDAYERLICDAMLGDGTLFARSDEVIASWELLTPVLERWEDEYPADFSNYPAGTWGPESADTMLAKHSRIWRLL